MLSERDQKQKRTYCEPMLIESSRKCKPTKVTAGRPVVAWGGGGGEGAGRNGWEELQGTGNLS